MSSSVDPISGDAKDPEKVPETESAKRDATPDIIVSTPTEKDEAEPETVSLLNEPEVEAEAHPDTKKSDVPASATIPEDKVERESSPSEKKEDPNSESSKKIISSEEEAKAKFAENRRKVKEQKEREAELERQRLVSLFLLWTLLRLPANYPRDLICQY